MTKYFWPLWSAGLCAALLIVMMLLISPKADAQINWVKCKHTQTGAVQMFPGMMCPIGWYQVW